MEIQGTITIITFFVALFLPRILMKYKVKFLHKIPGFKNKNDHTTMILATIGYAFLAFILMSLFLLLVTNPYYEEDSLYECKQGEYSIHKEYKEQMELEGVFVKSINLINDGERCKSIMVLEEPMNLLGTELTHIPLGDCSLSCMQKNVDSGSSHEQITNYCCQFDSFFEQ